MIVATEKQISREQPVLCIDLDGTLLRTNLLFETLLCLVEQKPWLVLMLPLWVAKGRASLDGAGGIQTEIWRVVHIQDMCNQPSWRANANRLHDLILASDVIHYVPIHLVEAWAEESGTGALAKEILRSPWYRHELRITQQSRAAEGPIANG